MYSYSLRCLRLYTQPNAAQDEGHAYPGICCLLASVPCCHCHALHAKLCTPHNVPLLITFFSAHHSPNTVNKKANEFVIGTVRLSSALPIKMKNHTLPVTLSSSGTAYAGLLSTPITA
jgi:hypothetical protein